MQQSRILSAQDMIRHAETAGFLPFFRHEIEGFSVEELTDSRLWFVDGIDGPWEWKGPAAAGKTCAYGKLFSGRAGFVSAQWYPDLANYRRDGYDFEGWYEDGKAAKIDQVIMEALQENGSCLSTDLKRLCAQKGLKGFDAALTRLQMQTFITVANFEYRLDRLGQPYGWGIARYAASDDFFGLEHMQSAAFVRSPEESLERILTHLRLLLPHIEEERLKSLIFYKR